MHYLRFLPLLAVFVIALSGVVTGLNGMGWGWLAAGFAAPLAALGVHDFFQTRRAVLANYPLLARFRFMFESVRPEIRQYFIEADGDEVPFSREQRALVYRRSKSIEGSRPFGTLKNVQLTGHEWLNHSIVPATIDSADFRVSVGGPDCAQPYISSILNISGMSFGALSPTAIEALNRGAKEGGFAHTTGEGSISEFHERGGGDLVWQIGSGYFGCRDAGGKFDASRFSERAASDQVKMIEIKLSQGAKPGHGGILPGPKVTDTIARTRGVPEGVDCISPATHSEFSTPIELLKFVEKLRELSAGKPVGIKLCIGHAWEVFAIAKAMVTTGILPDFITVDGAEGGTGAAPVEFADHIGLPLREGLMLVHNTLVGLGIRDRIRVVASGKIVSAFDIARVHALGGDMTNMARGFMFALGCIQAQSCHTGTCPTGVATQDPARYRALDVDTKYQRVANFHRNTLHAVMETVAAAGLSHPQEFTPHHLMMRINSREVRSAASQYPWAYHGSLLYGDLDHPTFEKFWNLASEYSFHQSPQHQPSSSRPLPDALPGAAQAS